MDVCHTSGDHLPHTTGELDPYDIQFKGLSNSKAGREVTEGMKQYVGLRQTGMRMDDLRFRLNFNLSKNEQLLYYVRELVTKLVTNFRT